MTPTAKTMSLRLRLFLVILPPLLVVSVLLGWWRISVAQDTSEDLFDRSLLAAALAISRDVAVSEGDALSPSTRRFISDAGGGEVFYHVTGPGGIYVTGYAYPPRPDADVPRDTPEYYLADYRDEPVRVLRMTETRTIDTMSGDTIVTVWQRVSDRQAFVRTMAYRAAALMAGIMVALALVVWFGVQVGLRPLNDLQDAIHKRSPDDLAPIRRPVPGEVSGVVSTLNRLLMQVRASIDAHQAFISDAAHQMRNPASALLALAETLPDVKSPLERREREQALINAARKSARLTEQLLSLERLRYDGVTQKELSDLTELARNVCADLGAEILARDIGFAFLPHEDPLPIACDPLLVSETIANLVHNSRQHGGPDLTRISVHTWRDEGHAVLSVEDDGRGIRPEDSERAFQRFGQLGAGEGSGLGLSISEEVVRSHGGDIWLDRVKTGTRVVFRLPLTL